MSSLLSSRSKNIQSVPASYVFPQEQRPGDIAAPVCKAIPIIDLSLVEGPDRDEIIQQIMKVTQDYGMFQVINHGVSEELMDDAMSLFKEFFDMPVEDKAEYYSEDKTKNCRLHTSGQKYLTDEVDYWKDTLSHRCHPLEDNIQFWPEKPARYREVVGKYSVEVRKLSLRIFDLLCEGLGIELGYFGDELSKIQGLVVNHYPPCPDPSLVLGVAGHCDPNLLTLLQQELYGLQIFKDEEWVGVEPIPHAFVINIANQLELISNGKLKSTLHRVVTNTTVARTSIATFITPSEESIIEPAKVLVTESNPQVFKAVPHEEYFNIFINKTRGRHDMPGIVLDSYKLQV